MAWNPSETNQAPNLKVMESKPISLEAHDQVEKEVADLLEQGLEEVEELPSTFYFLDVFGILSILSHSLRLMRKCCLRVLEEDK